MVVGMGINVGSLVAMAPHWRLFIVNLLYLFLMMFLLYKRKNKEENNNKGEIQASTQKIYHATQPS